MAIEAVKIRRAMGNINVALGQIEGLWSGVCEDTPGRRAEIVDMLRKSATILQDEAVLVEHFDSPTLRETQEGGVTFEGSVPFKYPPIEHHFAISKVQDDAISKEAVQALAAMAK